jgi:hypothetical protein
MKQIAVEWLELSLLGIISFDSEELRAKYRNAITKAKELEKQQITCAYNKSTYQFANDARIDYPKSAEQYYNETFNK